MIRATLLHLKASRLSNHRCFWSFLFTYLYLNIHIVEFNVPIFSMCTWLHVFVSVSAFNSPHGFPPFFHVFGPSDMKLLKSLSSKIRKASKRFRVKSRPPSRQRWDWKCSWTRLVILHQNREAGKLPYQIGIPKLTGFPNKNRWSRFKVLSLQKVFDPFNLSGRNFPLGIPSYHILS